LKIKRIGLLGGVASGKTLVAEMFEQFGAARLDGDQLGHEVLREPEMIAAARNRWGDAVLDQEGALDRAKLGRLVFAPPPGGPRELAHLEQLTHPRIGRMMHERIARLAAEGREVVVIDAAVMLKAGWDEFCDTIVFVEVPRDVRLSRAQHRGWSEEDFSAREAAQESLQIKRKRADYVIDNSGSPESTRSQVERIWQSLTG